MRAAMMAGSRRAITVTIAAETDRANVRTLASAPTDAVDVVVNVLAQCYSATPSEPGLRIGVGWAAGSTFRLVNSSTVFGCGGAGGAGGLAGTAGQAAGDAVWCDGQHVSIDNTGGYVWGGGGGGGGGAGNGASSHGGGGGGGQGREPGSGGAGSLGSAAGLGGSTSGPGAGGVGAGSGIFAGSTGGAGGAAGQAGNAGGDGSQTGNPGGAGGAAGRAVYLNGGSVTWLGGNNSAQVKGAVS